MDQQPQQPQPPQDQTAPLIDPNKIKEMIKPIPVTIPTDLKAQIKVPKERPQDFYWGTGRRKNSVARVRLSAGTGRFIINGREVDQYFPGCSDRNEVRSPLERTGCLTKYDIWVNVKGGGTTGQAGAVVLGIARALCLADSETFEVLRAGGFLTRDSRAVERKKYGQSGARRRFQFSKR